MAQCLECGKPAINCSYITNGKDKEVKSLRHQTPLALLPFSSCFPACEVSPISAPLLWPLPGAPSSLRLPPDQSLLLHEASKAVASSPLSPPELESPPTGPQVHWNKSLSFSTSAFSHLGMEMKLITSKNAYCFTVCHPLM